MGSLGNLLRLGAFSFGLAVAVGCGNVDKSLVECNNEASEFPTNIRDPVCGENEMTYDNINFACQEVSFYKPGICREIEECKSITPEDAACPAIYDPVCGENGETYGNSCDACRYVGEFEIGGTCEGSIFERND